MIAREGGGALSSLPEAFEEYRLIRLLGRGAMGEVYLAEDRLLERTVAIKFVVSASETRARERFFKEARALAKLVHPNVVAIYRVGEIKGRPFLVSEYVHGRSLDRVDKPVEWKQALNIGIDLARGLGAAHRKGILHRDVKPANAILAEDGAAKLLDFGLAELAPDAQVAPNDGGPSAKLVPPSMDSDLAATASMPENAPEPSAARSGALRSGARRAGGGPAGTPLYMAPELFLGESTTTRSDVYSLGALLFELCAGRPPHDGATIAELAEMVQSNDAPSLAELADGVDARFAEIINQCLERNSSKRPASAEALREALERIGMAGEAQAIPEGNPYRGLLPFEASHRGLFFGRGAEVRAILDRLIAEPFVLVTGDSGAGKSSLCRAGVVPVFAEQEKLSRAVQVVGLGRRPIESLAAVFAPLLGKDEASVAEALRHEPSALARELRQYEKGRILIFVDQLEELCTIAPADEARVASEALRALVDLPGRLRLLAAARSDFLGRISALPGIGEVVSTAIHLLRPMSADGLREAMAGPARAKGYSFQSESLVESLVQEVLPAPGALPLFAFALAELWEARDEKTKTIPTAALETMGGMGGALGRHADRVISALGVEERVSAKSILLALVTAEGTRNHLLEGELVRAVGAGEATRRAIDALLRGRLLVAQQSEEGGESAYTIAHEALLRGWDTLQGWLGHDAEARAARQQLLRAAQEWERLERVKDALWNDRQLREGRVLDNVALGELETAFLLASKRAARWNRLARWGAIVAVPLAIGGAVAAVRITQARELNRRVEVHRQEALAALKEADAEAQKAQKLRAEAFSHFDGGQESEGESRWGEARKTMAAADGAYSKACQSLETGLMLDGNRADLRDIFAQALYERALLREEQGRKEERDELIQRLGAYDTTGQRRERWNAPAKVTISTTPAGATVWLSRYETKDGKRIEGPKEQLGVTPVDGRPISQGSVVLSFEAAGKVPVRLPLLLGRNESRRVEIELPAAKDVPEGFVYVPAGRFLVGSAEPDEDRRRNERQPIHAVETGAFLIARQEVTFADWLRYVRALPEQERLVRLPKLKDEFQALELGEEQNRYRLTLKPDRRTYTALEGEMLRFPGRNHRVEQDWLRMPIAGISYDDALAYVAWMADTGKLRGARLCTPQEWERAARGADDRVYPHGDILEPDDANVDVTYGRDPLGFGPDEVGSHPASTSPFGVEDMAGNVWEWTAPFPGSKAPVARGGSYYQFERIARVINFQKMETMLRSAQIGVRVCATPGGGG